MAGRSPLAVIGSATVVLATNALGSSLSERHQQCRSRVPLDRHPDLKYGFYCRRANSHATIRILRAQQRVPAAPQDPAKEDEASSCPCGVV